jgi:hypothetical protein
LQKKLVFTSAKKTYTHGDVNLSGVEQFFLPPFLSLIPALKIFPAINIYRKINVTAAMYFHTLASNIAGSF